MVPEGSEVGQVDLLLRLSALAFYTFDTVSYCCAGIFIALASWVAAGVSSMLKRVHILWALIALLVATSVELFTLKNFGRTFPPLLQKQTVLNGGIKILVSENDVIENVVKKFKKSCYKAGFIQELRHKQRWETAAEKKKRKTIRARMQRKYVRANLLYQKLQRGQIYDT